MSKRPKKDSNKSAPRSAAGLIQYYDADLPGFKIGPYAVVILAVVLVVIVLSATMTAGFTSFFL